MFNNNNMYGTTQHHTHDIHDTHTEESCCKLKIIDKSEPLIITGIIASASGLTIALVAGSTGLVVVSSILTLSSIVSEWRVRSLGVAKGLMDSVRDLEGENIQLKTNNKKLESEIEKFQNIVGLLDENVGDIEKAKEELFNLYEKYQEENKKQESNNLLTLFGLVDRNQDSRLSPDELSRLAEYIKIVYGQEIDFEVLDKDDNGYVSLEEFFEKFRGKINKK